MCVILNIKQIKIKYISDKTGQFQRYTIFYMLYQVIPHQKKVLVGSRCDEKLK